MYTNANVNTNAGTGTSINISIDTSADIGANNRAGANINASISINKLIWNNDFICIFGVFKNCITIVVIYYLHTSHNIKVT